MTRYTIRGPVTGDRYLVEVFAGRWFLYPPGAWRVVSGWVKAAPGSQIEVTARWEWLSRRRARRYVRRVERRVARSMRTIYREHDQWRRAA